MLINFTEITNNNGPINKKYGSDGKKTQASVYEATGKTVEIELENFQQYLEDLSSQPEKALILGVSGHDEFDIRLSGSEDEKNGIISRTKKYFNYCNSDKVGIMYFDVDDNSAHGPWSEDKVGEFIDRLEKILKGCFIGRDGKDLSTLCRFVKDSSSAGVTDADGNRLGSGIHIYFPVRNPNEKIIELIFQWAWLNGYGTHLIDRSGRVHLRTIIDEAVKSPERLVFESDCEIDEGLRLIARECDYVPGGILDAELAMIALEMEIQGEFESKSEQYLENVRNSTECLEAKARYDQERANKLVESGVPERKARSIVKNRRDGILLSSDFLYKDDMTEIPVYDVLTGRDDWNGKGGFRDPIEPEYGKGKAKLFVNEYSVVLNCFAHGGITYVLKFDFDGIKQWVKDSDIDELEDLYAEYLAQSVLTQGQESKVAKMIANRLEDITKTDIKADTKEVKDEIREEISSMIDDDTYYGVSKDATHGDISSDMLRGFGDYRVYGGDLYVFGKSIWEKYSIGRLLNVTASRYAHCKLCVTGSHYNQIVKQLMNTAGNKMEVWEDEKGFPCSGSFWKVYEDGVRPIEYTKELGVRFKMGFEPDFEMATPMWDHVLKNVVNVECFQKAFGLALSGMLNDKLQQAAILKGPGGVGKGTTNRVMQAMLPPGRISAVSFGMMNIAERVGGLRDSLVNFIPEMPKRRKGQPPLNMEGFKKVTGGDAVTGRNLFRDAFTFFPSTSHFINMNDWPNIESFGSEIKRRLGGFIIEFQHNHTEVVERIDEVIVEHELPGVLAWAIEGVRKWIVDGNEDDHSNLLYEKWAKSVDTIETFLEDKCQFGPRFKVVRSGLFESYMDYCRIDGLTQLERNEFYKKMRKYKGLSEKRLNDNWYIIGLGLL